MTSCVFGERPARRILQSLGLDALFRAHQAIANGWEFPFEPWNGVVTIFSAPNYAGSFGNCGAVVSMNADLRCRFVVFEPKTIEQIVSTVRRPLGPEEAVVDPEKEEGDLTIRRFAC
jgi:serine/threonine-protein phosphatase PP1 catalytic subunit